MKTAIEILREEFDIDDWSSGHRGDVIDCMEAYAEQFKPKWLPMDTAPKDGTDILIQSDGQISVGRWHYHFVAGERWMGVCEGVAIDTNQDYPFVLSNPTGWMPLP